MTVHPLPAEPDRRPVPPPMSNSTGDTFPGDTFPGETFPGDNSPGPAEAQPIRSPRHRTSIRRSWVLAAEPHGSTDRRAA